MSFSVMELIDRPIAFQRCLVRVTGSITGALLLSQSIYWQKIAYKDVGTYKGGWWYKTQEEWEEETGMSRRELETARKACAKFLSYERRGIPAKGFYRVNKEALELALQTRLAESANLGRRKEPSQIGGISQSIAETKQETKAETTKAAQPPQPSLLEVTQPANGQQTNGSHKGNSEPPPTRAFTDWWIANYPAAHKGVPYVFRGPADGASLAPVLKAGVTVDYLKKIAKEAWANGCGFHCKHAATIRGFCGKLEDIAQELLAEGLKKNAPPRRGSTSSGVPPFKEGRSLYNDTEPCRFIEGRHL